MKLRLALAGSFLAGLALASAAHSQTSAPAFRVPLSATSSLGTGSPIWAWMQSVSQCSSTCGSGTRTTSYVCQNVSSYDYSGTGYGAPEPDASCTSGGAGAKPAATSASCTDYSGCSYTWVTPAVVTTPVSDGGNPAGRAGCGMVNLAYSPYCQRSDGTVMSAGDYRFCSTSSGYNVNPSSPDTLGYNRTVVQTTSCTNADNAWVVGSWGPNSSTCSANNTQLRTVVCQRTFDGTAEADSACSATKPATSQIVPNYSTCSYSWSTGAWSASSNTCSSSATQTRSVTCMRSSDGGTPTTDADCTNNGAGAKPATTQTIADYSTCTYAWTSGAWSASSSTCSSSATQTRTVSCVRSNGDTVASSYCAGTAPSSSQTVADYSGCSYSWQTGAWSAWSSGCSAAATQTRSVYCQRSNGDTVANSYCSGAAPAASQTGPNYASCSYSFYTGPWAGSSNTCSANSTQTRTVQCYRSDGTAMADSSCNAAGVGTPARSQTFADYSGCSYSWQTGAWSASSNTCSGSATQTRSVWCQRSDGATVGSGCSGAAPASSQQVADYSGCSYSASYGTYSACSNGTQSRPVTCTRSDGSQVDPSYCGTSSTQTQNCSSAACVSANNVMVAQAHSNGNWKGESCYTYGSGSASMMCNNMGTNTYAHGEAYIQYNGTTYTLSVTGYSASQGGKSTSTSQTIGGTTYVLTLSYGLSSGGLAVAQLSPVPPGC